MRRLLAIAWARRLASRRQRSDFGRWTLALGPLLMGACFWGLAGLPHRWAEALFQSAHPAATFLLLSFGVSGLLTAPAAGLRFFGNGEPELLQTLPLPPAIRFGGLTLGEASANLAVAAAVLLPALAYLFLQRELLVSLAGLAGSLLGLAAGAAAAAGLTVLVTRGVRPVWLGRAVLSAGLGGVPALAVGLPAHLPALVPLLLTVTVLAYVAGARGYAATYASWVGRGGAHPGGFFSYGRIHRWTRLPAGPGRAVAAKDLLMLGRHPVTPWRALLFLLALPAFSQVQTLLAGRGVERAPALTVGVYVGLLAALLLALELSATAFRAEDGRIALLLVQPVPFPAILGAKLAATLSLPLVGTVIGVLLTGRWADLTLTGYGLALTYSLPALLGVGVLTVGLAASMVDVGTVPEESSEAVLLEQAPLGRGMGVLGLGALLLGLAWALLWWFPTSGWALTGFLALTGAELVGGWLLGLRGLRSLLT